MRRCGFMLYCASMTDTYTTAADRKSGNRIEGDTASNIGGRPSPAGLWRPSHAADYLGMTVRTLERWRRAGKGPAWQRFPGGRYGIIRYDPNVVREWARAQTEDPEALAS